MKPVVAIWMLTYKHEKFIAQAIESVLMQKTNFSFRLFIGEDCSPDHTLEICLSYQNRYPEIITVLENKVNDIVLNAKNVQNACYNSGAKYTAFLEGDDYWTDPFKLQKQVDVLEANEDYAGCFHETQQIFDDGKLGKTYGRDANPVLYTEDTISTVSPFHTSSFMSKNIIKTFPEWYWNVTSGDMAFFSIVSSFGPLVKIPEIMSVYRKHENGMTNTLELKENFHAKRIELINYLNEFHQFKYNSKSMQVIDVHKHLMMEELQAGKNINNSFLNPRLSIENMDLFLVRSSILNALKKNLHKFRGTMLDLGCGEMPYKSVLLSNPSNVERYIGMDIENPTYQQNSRPDIFWDGKTIPLEDGSIDCAVATEFFEHIPYPETIMEEISRVLKPGGVLFITVPFIWPLHTMPYDEYRYTPFSLERILKNSGFGEINIKATGGWDASLAQVIGLWVRRRPMPAEARKEYSEKLFAFYKMLVESDRIPEDFSESMLITGLAASAQKTDTKPCSSVESDDSVKEYSEKPLQESVLAIVCPQVGAVSETFIRKHIENLAPGRTVILTAAVLDDSWFEGPVKIIPIELGSYSFSREIAEEVTGFFKEHSVTHILCEFGCIGGAVVKLNHQQLHLPIYVHFHGQDASEFLRKPEIASYYQWIGAVVDGIITVSKPMASRLRDIGIPEGKITINHYGVVYTESCDTVPESQPCRFLSVSRLVGKKGILFVLKAFEKAKSVVPDITLDIIGEGPLRGEIEQFIEDHKLSDSVLLLGQRTHDFVLDKMKKSCVFIQHSLVDPETGNREGLPLSILEASAQGLPVISTYHEGIPEAIGHRETGLLVNERDWEKMSEYIIELAKDPLLRKRMGGAGRNKILSEGFTVEATIENLRNFMGLSEKQGLKESAASGEPKIKRILFVNHDLYPFEHSGTPITTRNQASEMSKGGYVTAVLFPSPDLTEGFRKEQDKGITLYLVPRFDKYMAFMGMIEKPVLDRYMVSIGTIIDDFQPDAVHINDYVYMPEEIIALFHNSGIAVIRGVCNMEELCHMDYPVRFNGREVSLCEGPDSALKCAECFYANKLGRKPDEVKKEELHFVEDRIQNRFDSIRTAYRENVDAAIFTEASFREYYMRFVNIDKSITEIIPRGIRFNRPRTSNQRKLDSKKIRFAYVGNLIFAKGIDVLLKAFEKIAGFYDFTLDIYGTIGDQVYSGIIESLETRYPSQIKYHGSFQISDLDRISGSFDVAIVPSYFDTYNRIVRELLFFGVPLIITDFFGASVIRNNQNGLKIKVGDYDGLADAMKKMITDPNIVPEMSKEAMNTYIPSLDDEIGKIKEFYRNPRLNVAQNGRGYLEATSKTLQEANTAEVERTAMPDKSDIPSLNNAPVECSIIIPVFNKWEFTEQCLQSILNNPPKVNFEILVIDNASSDQTGSGLERYEGFLRVIKNPENAGYTLACNQGAAQSTGKYLVFLNNDTKPLNGWLDELALLANSGQEIGAVGAKLIYPDGKIQEAGGLIFSDGNGWNFGNGDDPKKETYNKICEVDYCSAACLLVRRDLFELVGGFDKRYAPAYYEDSDLCFSIRNIGYKVLYDPFAEITHFESVTAGKNNNDGFKRYIGINRWKFIDKWENELLRQDDPPALTGDPVTADRRRLQNSPAFPRYLYNSDTQFPGSGQHSITKEGVQHKEKKRVLFFFPHNPYPARTGAHRLALEMLRGFKEMGSEVTLFSSNIFTESEWTNQSAEYLHKTMGVDTVIYIGTQDDQRYIAEQNKAGKLVNWRSFVPLGMANGFGKFCKYYKPDVVVINYTYWGMLAGSNIQNAVKVIETHDLVTLNLKMRNALAPYLATNAKNDPDTVSPELLREDFFSASDFQADADEIGICDQFDYTLAVSPSESEIIEKNANHTKVLYTPITIDTKPIENDYKGLPLFVISNNPFNIQGYLYFAKKVLPEINRTVKDFAVNIIGDGCKSILPSKNVHLLGFVDELKQYYKNAPFAICPLIGGTGQQVKIVEAMSFGVPVVVMKNVAQNSPVIHRENGFIAADATEFAGYCELLFKDRELCASMGENARKTIQKKFSNKTLLNSLARIVNESEGRNRHTNGIKNILWLRPDAIGDNVLSSSMLPYIRRKYKNSRIIVVCQRNAAELYKNCPYTDRVIAYDKSLFIGNENYRNSFINDLKNLKIDTVLHSVYSRELLGDFMALAIGAKKVIGHSGDLANIDEESRRRNNALYTRLISCTEDSELCRHAEFLAGLGIKTDGLKPVLWTDDQDEKFAERFFTENSIDPKKSISLFAGAGTDIRLYNYYGKALEEICRDGRWTVIALGDSKDFLINQKSLDSSGARTFNMSGKLSLMRSAAIIKKCSLALGAETGLAHIACAAGTPNVIVIGGGHFGRFMPYSGLTTLVANPLKCFKCNWLCKYPEPYCIGRIDPRTITEAIKYSIGRTEFNKPVVFAQTDENPAGCEDIEGMLKPDSAVIAGYRVNTQPASDIRVSAVVSVYNSERFIKGCLDDLIGQTLYKKGELEIVIVNTGSEQNEELIIKEYERQHHNIRYIKTKQRETVYQAWNRGIKAARGRYITNANTDDRHRADAIEILAKELDTDPGIALAYGDQYVTRTENETFENHNACGCFSWPDYDRIQLIHVACCGPQPLWRKALHNEFGYFHDELKVAGDYEWWLRITEKYGAKHIGQFLGLYLLSEKSIEHQEDDACLTETRQVRQYYANKAGLEKLDYQRYKSTFLNLYPESPNEEFLHQPLVSVIVPTYNRPEFLKETIKSILTQTYKNIEIMVVNDGGQDVSGMLKSLGGKSIKYLQHQTNKGPAAVRNTGIMNARGKYIAYLDDDDIYYPNHIETLVTSLEKSEYKIAYSDAYRTIQQFRGGHYETIQKDVPFSFEFSRDRLLCLNISPTQCFMHEKSVSDEIGLFDTSLPAHEDWEYWIRLSGKYEFLHLPVITSEFRQRTDSTNMTTTRRMEFYTSYREVVARYYPETRNKPGIEDAQIKILDGLRRESPLNSVWEKHDILVSVIIPVFNNCDLTRNCLYSLYKNTSGIKYEVIIVDNGSTDQTAEFLKFAEKIYPNLIVISATENLGFASANNIGAENSSGKYILCLNNDTEPKTGWLKPLVDIVENDASVGAAGSKLLFPDGKIQHAGVVIINDKALPDPLVARHIYWKGNPELKEANLKRTYQALTAACLLIRKSAFDQAGGFDQEYWNGYEDVDLCFKLGERGWKLVYQPASTIIHHESQSGPERFSKVSGNIERLHKKWLDKIKPDFIIEKNGKTSATDAGIIKEYSPEKDRENLVSILVLTFNGLKYNKEFFGSVEKCTEQDHEIIVVDNASTDGTVEYLKGLQNRHKNIKLIFNDSNLGFPKAVNQGIKASSGNYLLIANNDIVVTEGWLERMTEIAESDPGIGIVGPISNAVSGVQIDKNAKYKNMAEMRKYARKVRTQNKGRILEFPRVAFLCTLIKREVIDSIGGLDERFSPGNYEDDDFCLRAQKAGFKAVIAKDLFIHHYGSKSFKAGGEQEYAERLEINKNIFVDKWGATVEDIWLKGSPTKERTISYPIDKDEFIESYRRGILNLQDSEYVHAKRELLSALKLYDDSGRKDSVQEYINALDICGSLCLMDGNFEAAADYYERELKLAPESASACLGLGQTFLGAGIYQESKTMFEWALNYDPASEMASSGLSAANKNLCLPEDDNSLKAAGSVDDRATGGISKAEALINEGRLNEALAILEDILRDNPKNIDALNDITVVSVLTGNYDAAADFIDSALSLDPGNEVAIGNLDYLDEAVKEKEGRLSNADNLLAVKQAEDFIENGQIQQAVNLLSGIITNDPGNTDALNDLAVAAIKAEDYDSTADFISRVLKIDPENETALGNLDYLEEMIKGRN